MNRLDTNKSTYQQRQSVKNVAEDRFEKYCNDRHIEWHRFGFDEKSGNIGNFFLIDPVLRNLPDYVVSAKNKIFFVQVKGTNKIKIKEIEYYKRFWELFGNKDCEFVFYFMFSDSVRVLSLEQLCSLQVSLPIKRFETDKKEYIELHI